jgi:phosphoribosylanthranilate isomerase
VSRLLIKICGLSTPETVAAAVEAGAEMIGLNFHPRSPRYVTPERAATLAAPVRGKTAIVALTVNRSLDEVSAIAGVLRPDWIQLHGDEPPEAVAEAASAAGTQSLKAIGVAVAADLAIAPAFAAAADLLLIDAKPPKDAAYPGGHGRPFDWDILKALNPETPFLLSGGLTPENVGEAIRIVRGYGLNLAGVDVSSGVESAPGVKDEAKIRAFVAAARAAG